MRTTGLFAVTALVALLLTAGCAANPKNKTLIVVQYAQTEACAKAYEKAGWVRLGDY